MKNYFTLLKRDCAFVISTLNQERNHLFLILLSVLLGNILGIFGDHGFYLDDHFRYTFATHHQFPWYIGERNYLRPFITYPMYLMMAISPYWARFLETILFLVPLSWCFFILFKYLFNLPTMLCMGAAIIPGILPAQEAIPSFIDGCYTVQGLLSVMPVIFCGYQFLSRNNFIYLVLAIGFFFLGLQMMDHTIFLAVPFFSYFFYIIYIKKNKNGFWLFPPMTILVIVKIIRALQNPVSANKVTTISTSEILTRFKLSFFQSNPFAFAINWFLKKNDSPVGMWFTLVLLIGGLIFLLPAINKKLKKDLQTYPTYALWAFIWMVSSSLPFLIISPDYSSRYMHIPAYGANLAILINLYLFFSLRGHTKYFRSLIIALIIFTGILRQVYLFNWFAPSNHYVKVLKEELHRFSYVPNAQIMIAGNNAIPTGEYWHYTSGALQFYLNRKDIEGNMGTERYFYDPFQYPDGQAFTFKANGFELGRPFYLFRLENDKLEQLEYALQWFDNDRRWKIHQFNRDTGALIRSIQGQGVTELEKTIDSQNIGKNHLLWYKYNHI